MKEDWDIMELAKVGNTVHFYQGIEAQSKELVLSRSIQNDIGRILQSGNV